MVRYITQTYVSLTGGFGGLDKNKGFLNEHLLFGSRGIPNIERFGKTAGEAVVE